MIVPKYKKVKLYEKCAFESLKHIINSANNGSRLIPYSVGLRCLPLPELASSRLEKAVQQHMACRSMDNEHHAMFNVYTLREVSKSISSSLAVPTRTTARTGRHRDPAHVYARISIRRP